VCSHLTRLQAFLDVKFCIE